MNIIRFRGKFLRVLPKNVQYDDPRSTLRLFMARSNLPSWLLYGRSSWIL